MSQHQSIIPLWQQIGEIFKYGFNRVPLFVALWSSLLLSIASVVDFLPLKMIFILIAVFYPVKYGYICMAETADGKLTPPDLYQQKITLGYEPLFKHLVVLVVFMAMIRSLEEISPTFGFIFLYAGFLLLPASIMLIGVSYQFLAMFDVKLIKKLVITLKESYFILYLLWIIWYQSKVFIFSHLILDQAFYFVFIYGFLDSFFTIILFYMMGYLMYQDHQALGHTPHYDQTFIAKKEGKSLISGISPLFDQFIAENNQVAALAELKTVAKLKPDDVQIQKQLQSMLKSSNDSKTLAHQSEKILHQQLAAKNYKDAVDSYLIILKNNPEKPPLIHNERDYLPFAQVLKANNEAKAVVKLLKIFQANFPRSNEKPAFFLFVATVLSEDLNREDKAINLLQGVIKAYPNHPLILKIINYKNQLEKINKPYQ